MALGIKIGVNTVPGGKKCGPTAAAHTTVKSAAPRNLNTVALEARLRALGHRARESLEEPTRGANTRPEGKKNEVIEHIKKFLQNVFGRPVHTTPVRPTKVNVNDGVYHPGTSTTIEVGINTTPGGKKQNPTVMV